MRWTLTVTFLATIILVRPVVAQQGNPGNFVPGSGTELEQVGDDFEDPNWTYQYNNPKSTEELNEQQNQPLGKSANGRWFEGVKRGQPDIVQRVETPPGGIPGSTGAMLLRSLQTGIPNRPSNKMQQEDFILNVQYRTGGPVAISENPSVTTRVYLPPTDKWERRSGPHFAFRIALETTKTVPRKLLAFATKEENETYWPGLFICMDTKEQTKAGHDRLYFRLRADRRGGDTLGPEITTTGWWTLGMSISANGAVHYYAKPGVDDLTADDHIMTQFPYSYRAERFRAAFFNVINGDNGRDWSTTWVIDDTKVFLGTKPNVQLVRTPATQRSVGVGTRGSARQSPEALLVESQSSAQSALGVATERQKTRAQLSQSETSQIRIPQPPPAHATAKEVRTQSKPAKTASQPKITVPPKAAEVNEELELLELDYYR